MAEKPQEPPVYTSKNESGVTWVHLGNREWYDLRKLKPVDKKGYGEFQEQIKEARARRDQKEREEREKAEVVSLTSPLGRLVLAPT